MRGVCAEHTHVCSLGSEPDARQCFCVCAHLPEVCVCLSPLASTVPSTTRVLQPLSRLGRAIPGFR